MRLFDPRLYVWLIAVGTWCAAIINYVIFGELTLIPLSAIIIFSAFGFIFTVFQLWKESGLRTFFPYLVLLLFFTGIGAATNYFLLITNLLRLPRGIFNALQDFPIYSILALFGLIILYLPIVRRTKKFVFPLLIEGFIFGFAVVSSAYYINSLFTPL